MEKLRIAVLFGGLSPEHKVSLESAYSVITNIDKNKYEPVMLGITCRGEWFRFNGDPLKIKDGSWNNPKDCVKAAISLSRSDHGILEFWPDGVKLVNVDAIMPVLHGKNGEDGTVQGLAELAGIPLIGCGSLSSAICMDKDKAHKLASLSGIRTPRSFVINSLNEIEEAKSPGYPLFVKPVRAGSSFGITKVNKEEDLADAVKLAFTYDTSVILEEYIPGFEVGCAIIGNGGLITGELDEIELFNGFSGFFDYKEKYTLESSQIHVPARIQPKKAREIKESAKIIYKALDCKGFARVDMFLTPDGQIVFNEVNTIPGFTSHSRFPNMFKAAGMSLTEVISHVIELAVGV